MDPNVLTAVISASAAVVTAITALIANHRAFGILDSRINDTNRGIDETNANLGRRIDETNANLARRMDHQNKRLDSMSQDLREIRSDLKQFFQIQADFDKRLGRIEDKLGIPPHQIFRLSRLVPRT
jgi:septal ring factor EnvC (AmiA/AmiB activator)